MRLLSVVQARRVWTAFGLIVSVLVLVPQWSGAVRLPLPAPNADFTARPANVGTRHYGALRLVGIIRLESSDAGFGGFSAMAIERGRVTLLGDGGNWARFVLRRGAAVQRAMGALPAGPGTGWEKPDRDSESLAIVKEQAWIGFERANAIWRYDADLSHARAFARPRGMADWPVNGGAESLAWLPDGRFIAIAEESRRRAPHAALLFSRDPTAPRTTVAPLRYVPPAGYAPVDAAALPSGDLLVLNRRFRLPFRFSTTLVLVPRAAIRAGAVLRGRAVATIDGELAENWEALAVTRARGCTTIWLANDNDGAIWRPSLLAKFVWRDGGRCDADREIRRRRAS